MSEMAIVTGISPIPERNENHVLQIKQPDGTLILAEVDLGTAQTIVRILQPRLATWAHKSSRNLSLPVLVINGCDVAHQGRSAELMAHTDQMGTCVLKMNDATLKKCRAEIDRVATYRSAPTLAH